MHEEKIILLVEDNPDDEELTIMGFEENSIRNRIVVAHDGVEALDYLFGTGTHEGRDVTDLPQLVVLDLKLPKVDGIEVLRRIKADERTRFMPVVILTSSKEERDLVESYQLGVNAYVQKPIDFSEFGKAVKHLGMFWLLLNQCPPAPKRSV